MSALDGLGEKTRRIDVDMSVLEWFIWNERNEPLAKLAAEELAALEHLAAVARDVNEWLKTIDIGGTGHQRSLEAALAELEKK